jgi:hypothetical protein
MAVACSATHSKQLLVDLFTINVKPAIVAISSIHGKPPEPSQLHDQFHFPGLGLTLQRWEFTPKSQCTPVVTRPSGDSLLIRPLSVDLKFVLASAKAWV